MSLLKKRLIIIGGTSRIGLATAKLVASQSMQLVITGFNPIDQSLKDTLPKDTQFYQLDIANEDAVQTFFKSIGEFDYLTTPGSMVPKGSFLTMETIRAKSGFNSKYWGQYYAAKYGTPHIRRGGAIVLFSGMVSQKPQKNLVVMASVNSAVEGLGRALAIELAPIRVNVVAPGIIDTPRYKTMPEDDRQAMFNQLSEKIPVGHIGQANEVAEVVLLLLNNTFMTGQTIFVDGGHLLI
ncbi:MAG: SDR family oxidoreductase [Gammaproteobacteria bacterium]|nr:SDR family oxidoreductase [Gammaproteobacteria bacterium]